MEIWDLYDELRKPLGKLHLRGVDLAAGEYHLVVEVFTINADGRLLLTQRDPQKTYPLLWESTGGSIIAGETSIEGAIRELEEETGLAASAEQLKKIGELKNGSYFRDIYIWKTEQNIRLEKLKLQPGEVCDAKLATIEELTEMNRQSLMVPVVWERYEMYWDSILEMMGMETSK